MFNYQFFLLEIIDMKEDPFQEIKLHFEYTAMKVQFCNFNLNEELDLFCTSAINIKMDVII